MGIIGTILGLYRDNGKEHGNYYIIGFRVQGLVSRLITPITHIVIPFIQTINLLTKSP